MNPLGHLSQALSPAGLLLGGGFLAIMLLLPMCSALG